MSCTLLRLRDVNLAHRLYSALDADNTDKLPWIDIVAPLVMLAAGQMGKGQREVLLAGLQLFEVVTPPLTMASTLKVLTMAAGSRLERLEVEPRLDGLRASRPPPPPRTSPMTSFRRRQLPGAKRVPSNLNPSACCRCSGVPRTRGRREPSGTQLILKINHRAMLRLSPPYNSLLFTAEPAICRCGEGLPVPRRRRGGRELGSRPGKTWKS